ncbi:unnamed protein product [Prorocentrum cordatum]|nr:unnamed protein product [Polarella glacialis]
MHGPPARPPARRAARRKAGGEVRRAPSAQRRRTPSRESPWAPRAWPARERPEGLAGANRVLGRSKVVLGGPPTVCCTTA